MRLKGEKIGLYLSGQPIQIKSCNIALTQPRIKDVVMFGEDDFLIAANILGHTDNITKQLREGNSQLEPFNDFQLLLVVLREEPNVRKTILNFLQLIFPNYDIKIEDASIDFFVTQEEQKIIVGQIQPFNFEEVQQVINDLFEPKTGNDEPEYNPANEKAEEIARKIKEGRERRNKQFSEKEGDQSLFGRYTSILSIGMSLSIWELYEYTPFQLYDAFARYFAKVTSDVYTRVSTMPLMDVSKMETPEEWIRNLYK